MSTPKLKRNKKRKPQVLDDLFNKPQQFNGKKRKWTEDKNLKEKESIKN